MRKVWLGFLSLLFSMIFSGMVFADDHGNNCSSATTVGINSTTNGSVETAGDYDYFREQVPSSGTLTLYTTGGTDTYGYLKDSSCNTIDSNDDSGSLNFRISLSVDTGTYYVAVRHYNSNETGNYTLHVECCGGGPLQLPWSTVDRLDQIVAPHYGPQYETRPKLMSSTDMDNFHWMRHFGGKFYYFPQQNILWFSFDYFSTRDGIFNQFSSEISLPFQPSWVRVFRATSPQGGYTANMVSVREHNGSWIASLGDVDTTQTGLVGYKL